MDQSGQSSRRLSSLISRFQKDTRPPEEKKSNQNQGAKIDLRNQNATTSHTDKHPNTPDPLKRVGSSNGGYLPVIQSSYYPESSGLETRNNHVHDWVAKATSPASEVKIAVAKEIGPASVVIVAVAEETSPASDVETTVAKKSSPASEVKATVAKETRLASAVETAATKETSPASEAKQTVAKETSPVTEIETAVPKETNHSLEVKNPIQPFLSQVERDAETVVDDSRNLPETGTVDAAEEDAWDTEAGAENEEAPDEDGSVGFATGHSGDYDEIADFDVDELLEESSDEELPTLQEIYQRCQTIRKRRFYEDLYNVWSACSFTFTISNVISNAFLRFYKRNGFIGARSLNPETPNTCMDICMYECVCSSGRVQGEIRP